MRTICCHGRAWAFSLVEMLCVMAIIGVLAALLLPALNQAQARAQRVACVSNLHELGIAFQSFAQDHNSRFPMQVPAAAGGALEFVQSAYSLNGRFYFAFRLFQPLSNELVTPKLLVCPADHRQPAPNFALLQNSNISYFVALTAEYGRPDSLLAGDGNLTNDWMEGATLLRLGQGSPLHWTRERHQFHGNLLFADGRVVERNTLGITSAGAGQTALFLPTLRMPADPPLASHGWPSPDASPTTSPAMTEPGTTRPPLPSRVVLSTPTAQAAFAPAPAVSNAPSVPEGSFGPRSFSSAGRPPAPEPGFSLLPPWIGPLARLVARLTGAFWYLGLLLLVLALAWARNRLQPKRFRPHLPPAHSFKDRVR
jgi:prepilin-type N-terminal cleavage/methylation domain-containing protein/prepilin-type processing-associated H-X9-DG protein